VALGESGVPICMGFSRAGFWFLPNLGVHRSSVKFSAGLPGFQDEKGHLNSDALAGAGMVCNYIKIGFPS
jgi:hypothetical protein